jgi:hypothetical protein
LQKKGGYTKLIASSLFRCCWPQNVKINSDEKHAVFAHELQSILKLMVGFSNVYLEILIVIATGYGLYGPGTESRWGEIFYTLQTEPGVYPAPYKMPTESFLAVKRPGRGVEHPPHLAPDVK